MIVWIGEPLLLSVHELLVDRHGVLPGIRDPGVLAAVLARPQQWHANVEPAPDLADLAAILAHGLVRERPFLSGNKRTAHVAYRCFLALNQALLSATQEQKIQAIVALAAGHWSAERFGGWLRQRLFTDNGGIIHEPAVHYGRGA